jgi:hypothetical protein
MPTSETLALDFNFRLDALATLPHFPSFSLSRRARLYFPKLQRMRIP